MVARLLPVVVMLVLVLGLIVGARRPSGLRLDIEDDELVIRIGWKDAFYALRSSIRLPIGQIRGVAATPRQLVPHKGLRLPGTGIPGVLRAGSYGVGDRRDFWLVRRAPQVLVIELERGAQFRRIVLEVPDPHAEALRLRPGLGTYTGSFEA